MSETAQTEPSVICWECKGPGREGFMANLCKKCGAQAHAVLVRSFRKHFGRASYNTHLIHGKTNTDA